MGLKIIMIKNLRFFLVFVFVTTMGGLFSLDNTNELQINETKETEPSSHLPSDERTEMVALETIIVEKLKEFRQEMNRYNDYELYKTNISRLEDSLKEPVAYLETLLQRNKIEKYPKTIVNELEEIYLNYFYKYMDQHLKEDGILLSGRYNGCFFLYLETVKRYKVLELQGLEEYRHVRFKINSSKNFSTNQDFTNVILILKNKDDFELVRKSIGKIKKGFEATGELNIKESDYKEFFSAVIMTDQDY